MWGSPSTMLSPYSKVARPSPVHVSSKMPVAPFTPLTRSPLRKPRPRLRSSTNCAMAARNAACWLADIESKSALNRANHAKVGNDRYADEEERRPRLARLRRAPMNSSPEPNVSIRPATWSASASRSPACHSGDQNHAWVASMSFCGRSKMPSAVNSASRRSPSSRWAARRMSSGRVSWPLARRVVLGTE